MFAWKKVAGRKKTPSDAPSAWRRSTKNAENHH